MTKVTMSTSAGKKVTIVSEKTTLRQLLDDNGINYNESTTFMNSVPRGKQDLDRSLEDLGAGDEVRISSVVKMDNAAKIEVNGSAAVLTSEYKLEDWKRIAEVFPDALTMYDEDTDEPVFVVGLDEEGYGELQSIGATFSPVPGKDGKATITMLLDTTCEDPKATLAKRVGEGLLRLNDMEKALPDILKDVEAREKEINDYISVI